MHRDFFRTFVKLKHLVKENWLKLTVFPVGGILISAILITGAVCIFGGGDNESKVPEDGTSAPDVQSGISEPMTDINAQATGFVTEGSSSEDGSLAPGEESESSSEQSTSAFSRNPEILVVAVDCDGERRMLRVSGGLVSDVLDAAGIVLGEQDIVVPGTDVEVFDQMAVTVYRITTEQLEYTVNITYDTEYVDSDELYQGETEVLQKGAAGLRKIVLEKTMRDGIMIENRTLSSEIVTDAVTEIVARGTKPVETTAVTTTRTQTYTTTTPAPTTTTTRAPATEPPVLGEETITINGTVYTIKETLTGTAYAYYSDQENPLTYSGNPAVVGATVAVDPSVIPLGSIVYVTSLDGTSWSYGPAYAHDIGGGIKGTNVDLFMATKADCYAHGARSCRVYIITPS